MQTAPRPPRWASSRPPTTRTQGGTVCRPLTGTGLAHTTEGNRRLYDPAEALPPLYAAPAAGYDLTAERARLAHHQANRAQLEADQLAGRLLDVETVAAVVGEDYSRLRARLLALPHKLAPLLLGETERAAAYSALEDAMREALTELSEAEDLAA